MEKRGILQSTVIFIILNAVFFAAMLFFVAWAGTNVSVKEQTYAKEIALLIDQAKPGTNLTMDISELYNLAEKNKYTGEIIKIDSGTKEVNIKLILGKGYSFKYFNSAAITWGANKEDKKLYIQVK